MLIEKRSTCKIFVRSGDFISDVTVRNNNDLHENQLGCIIRENGNPHFVCTELIVEGGKVSNIQIQTGGKVKAQEGELLDIELMQGGVLNCSNATIHGLKEVGGAFFIDATSQEPEYSCTFKGFIAYIDTLCTIHRGTQINNTSLCGNARCIVYDGGILSNSKVNINAEISVRGGIIDSIVSVGCIEFHKGCIQYTKIDNGKLILFSKQSKKFTNTSVSNKAIIIRKANSVGDIPSLDGLTIEDGTKIINEIDEGDNGIYRETIIWNNKVNKKG